MPQYSELEHIAASMLAEAIIPYSETDVLLLAEDIYAVAREDSRYPVDSLKYTRAARILRKRIGGIRNLEGYMRCLRVPAMKSLTSRVRDGKLSTTEPEGN